MPNHPSIVARRTATGFEGRYVHNDGHPSQRLPLLLDLYAGPFARDLDAMTRFLIDTHPAGWSQLGPDPAVDTGWVNGRSQLGYAEHFVCHCHGDRAETPLLCTESTADPDLDEWIYVLAPDGIRVLEGTELGYQPWPLGPLVPWNAAANAA